MIESSRVLACVAVSVLCVVAGFLVSETQRNSYTAEGNTDPHACLTFALVNNSNSGENTQGTQQKSPWYASPEWWLVIFAIPTLVFVAVQARETARSAKTGEIATKT